MGNPKALRPLREFVLARRTAAAAAAGLAASPAPAHVSEQGFVLLLPTDLYIAGGVASVLLTVLLLALLPPSAAMTAFRPVGRIPRLAPRLAAVLSTASFLVLVALVLAGWRGPHDPLANPLPLTVWTLWWIGLVSLQGGVFDHWRWSNPWTGPLGLVRRLTGLRTPLRLPRRLGRWPAVLVLLAFAGFVLADPAPADPERLATVVALYGSATLLAGLLFGPRWLLQGEALTVLMRSYGLAAPLRARAGLWGWQILSRRLTGVSAAIFCLMILGIGSFDGLNETFWWFGLIGINPLEFPGRSAVIAQNLIGLVAVNLLLCGAFALCIRAGLRLARDPAPFAGAFTAFAPAILPIALGYHVAHYLPSFLVDVQWAALAANDPLATGADILGLGAYEVTTGFFNTRDSVRAIWLSQAGAVVLGHILSILLAHAIALREFGDPRRATLSQAPLATFMVVYTLFGLWLLASPRGV